jgi:GalNAc-alpha-(1->4)-GalNAc-alpha-(1->3)-diNAcBac-PP-undecaprenol alpha-1,4-N-acetyl-D-galactosaminyltransferase
MRLKRLVVMPNAVRISDDSFFDVGAIDEPRSPFILAIGRLIRQKGFDLLLDAFSRSRLQESGWRLVILGEGTERDALLQQANRLGVRDSVSLPGHVTNLGQWLDRADMFVMPSRYEGFPNTLLEAMQMGRACVSFDCPSGPSMIIDHEQSGLLIPGQDVEEMAGALRRLAFDQAIRHRLGKEASKVNQRFSPKVVYGKWIELIDAVVRSNASTPS